ncbi:MAG: dihydrolipoamide acetyltransferase family protein [Armatimonadota bacterium]
MSDIIMPKMSDAMEEGKVLRWIKQPGDDVQKGEPIAEIETDKANVEIEATDSGVLSEIRIPEGESVPIGTPIAVVLPAGEIAGVKGGAAPPAPPEERKEEVKPPPAPRVEERPEAPRVVEPAPPPPPTAAAPPRLEEEEFKVSPLARKIARDAGVDLREIKGTGPGGRIVESDVRSFIEGGARPRPAAEEEAPAVPAPTPAATAPQIAAQAPGPPALVTREMTVGRIWESVGKRMTESKQQTPHFYVTTEVDMDEALRVREWMNKSRPEDHQISVNDIIVKACAIALVKHPIINASYGGDNKITLHPEVNIGIAVAIPEGLITPVVRNCEKKSLSTISDEAKDLVARTRSGQIRPEEYSGGTFTVTNMGMYDVEEFSAIIVPPQAVILAAGAATPKPVAVDNSIEIRHMMRITASADHRVADGARVAEFLKDVKQSLESPMTLLE